MADLSGLLGLSDGHFSRAFRASLGHSPYAFIVDRRLARAMGMIRTSAHSLAEIAQACGFCDQPHLTKCFRRSLGTTPAAWRRAQDAGGPPAPMLVSQAFPAVRPERVQGAAA